MKYITFLLLFFSTALLAQNQNDGADCIILKDENSIICKFTHDRIAEDKEVIFHWIEPDGKVSRKRVMQIPAFHGSVYDYRYIQGRTKGTWTFKVIDGKNEYTTNFEIK